MVSTPRGARSAQPNECSCRTRARAAAQLFSPLQIGRRPRRELEQMRTRTIDADMAHAPSNSAGLPSMTLSRGQGTGARLKSEPPIDPRSALTQLGSRLWRLLTAQPPSQCDRRRAQRSRDLGDHGRRIMGSSPCKLTTTSPEGMPRVCATSAMRSVPMHAGRRQNAIAPTSAPPPKIRLIVGRHDDGCRPLLQALSQTHWMERPVRDGNSGFPADGWLRSARNDDVNMRGFLRCQRPEQRSSAPSTQPPREHTGIPSRTP